MPGKKSQKSAVSTAKPSRFVCHACIGDSYLKAEVTQQNRHICVNCGKKRPATAFEELCERIHEIIWEEFERTQSEPDSWAYYKEMEFDWEREGDSVEEVLDELLECDENLVKLVKDYLSDRYYSFDDAKMGEEDPYGDEVRYQLRRPNDNELQYEWSSFEEEIRTKARFFSRRAKSTLDAIFGELNKFKNRKRQLVREAGPGTETEAVYRARRAFGSKEIARIVENPARELGAPPSKHAGSGRMNPRWISMFYGAFDPETCVAEIRAPVGSAVILGKFSIVRKLLLLDLGAMRNLFVDRASYFDPAFRGLRDKARFLQRLVDIMSRPVMPGEEDYEYLPTQAVAEYLAEKIKPKLDGLIFPSSQRAGVGENVVLFKRASGVEPDGTENIDSQTSFGWSTEDDSDDSITIWSKPRPGPEPKPVEPSDTFFMEEAPLNEYLMSGETPALKIDLASVEVRQVESIEYITTSRRVSRYQEPDEKHTDF